MKNQSKRPELLAGERHQNESDKAVSACNDWLNLGEGRTLSSLLEIYTNQDISKKKPPSLSYATLSTWSSKFNWPSRAASFDGENEKIKNEIASRKRLEIMNHPLANPYGRLDKLISLFEKIDDELEKGLYATELRVAPGGFEYENEIFSKDIVKEFRGLLDDISKETGGRIKKVEVKTVREQVVEALRLNKISKESVVRELGENIADQLFVEAGVNA